LQPTDLRKVVKDVVVSFQPDAARRGVNLKSEVPDTPVEVVADRRDLNLMISNLVDNALKYTPQDGEVTVFASLEERTAILEVRDTGIGIEPRDHDRIFERFYRVDKARSREMGGTGLGLSIVRNIAVSLGGRVSVESLPGRGSTFRVELPTGEEG